MTAFYRIEHRQVLPPPSFLLPSLHWLSLHFFPPSPPSFTPFLIYSLSSFPFPAFHPSPPPFTPFLIYFLSPLLLSHSTSLPSSFTLFPSPFPFLYFLNYILANFPNFLPSSFNTHSHSPPSFFANWLLSPLILLHSEQMRFPSFHSFPLFLSPLLSPLSSLLSDFEYYSS